MEECLGYVSILDALACVIVLVVVDVCVGCGWCSVSFCVFYVAFSLLAEARLVGCSFACGC